MQGLAKLSIAKIGFAVAGICIFGVGIRLDDARIRWVGIGLVAVAWFLRFAGPKRVGELESQLPDETR